MEDKLREIVSRIGEVPADFSAEASLTDDLQIDSFRAMEIMFEIEREFDVQMPADRYAELRNFNDMVKLVTEVVG